MAFLSGLPMALAAMGSGVMSYYSTAKSNRENVALAERQMDFQRVMSSTAYQRAVQDMREAGVNPILAYQQGGASTPSGSTARVEPALAQGVSSALAVARARADVQQVEAQTQLLRSQAQLVRAQAIWPSLINSALGVSQDKPSGSLGDMLKWIFKTIGEGVNKE